MSKLKQFFFTPVCISCGSFFCGPSLFCELCYQLGIRDRVVEASESPFGERHQYLLEWKNGDSEYISQLVYRMKSDNSVLAWNHYADLLAARVHEAIDGRNFAAVVPIPSANTKSVHAKLLAENLAEKLQLPMLDILQKKGGTDQKSLSAAERAKVQNIELKADAGEEFTDPASRHRKYIFVDDVLTTGESFKQAAAALSSARNNLIATLFYRSKKGLGLH